MTTTASSSVLLAGSALVLAGMSFYLWPKNTKTKGLGEIDDISDEDYITADEVVQIFDRLFLEMQAVLAGLMKQVQQIQAMGQAVPERQLQQLIRQEMERALAAKQVEIFKEFDMDGDCLEEAVWEFLGVKSADATEPPPAAEPKVVKAVDRFQKLWTTATGQDVAGWRPGKAAASSSSRAPVEIMSAEKTIQVADKYFSALTECMRNLVQTYKAQGKDLQSEQVQRELNMEFASMANDAGEAALGKEGLTLDAFEASVKEHGNNPVVGRALGMMQMKQQQELAMMGSS